MKKILIAFFSIIMILPFTAMGKNKGCGFKGKVNGVKMRSFHCEISQAGTKPYMLFGFRYRGHNYMVDLNGIQSFSGRSKMRISAMKMRGRRMLKTYRSVAYQKILKDRKVKKLYGFFGGFRLQSKSGETLDIRGIFAWKIDNFPKKDKQGQLSYVLGRLKLGPVKAKIKSWNSAYQINKMILVRGGETITLTLNFPSDKAGSYRGKKCYARIMHFKIGADRKMKSRFLKGENIRVRIFKRRRRKTIIFNGFLRGKGQKVKIVGKFIE